MQPLLFSFITALRLCFNPSVQRIIFFSLIITLVALGLWVVFLPTLLVTLGDWTGWMDVGAVFGGALIGGVTAWFLFPTIVPLIAGFYDEKLMRVSSQARQIENIPDFQQPWWHNGWQMVRFLGKALLLNILCFPLYFIPVLNLFVYAGLNSYLLGREFFLSTSAFYIAPEQRNALWENHKMAWMVRGGLVLIVSTIPLLNLLSPIWAVLLFSCSYQEPARPQKMRVVGES